MVDHAIKPLVFKEQWLPLFSLLPTSYKVFPKHHCPLMQHYKPSLFPLPEKGTW